MAERERRERRRGSGALTDRPRKSPVSLLIVMVVGVVTVSAAASVLFGTGYGDETPHGKVLGTLQRVARAEEAYHASNGRFAAELGDLAVTPPDSVEVALTVEAGEWQAVATHPIGLSCVQSGRVARGRVVRDEAGCFTTGP